ncbi:hypothetical protein D3C81_226240 [compost metagenome]
MAVPNFTGTEPPKGIAVSDETYVPGKSFLESFLEKNPDITFTRESIMSGLANIMTERYGVEKTQEAIDELRSRWNPPLEDEALSEPVTTMQDPVGDMIRHFAIFYEHVVLLEGYPKDVQPQLKELKLLGKRIHECLIVNGELNAVNVKRCEEAHMNVTLSEVTGEKDGSKNGWFIQVARGKAILRQRV